MNTWRIPGLFLSVLALLILHTPAVTAHCDSMDGPVVKAAQQALAEGNVKLVLVWVTSQAEREVARAFEKTVTVRKLGVQARELADVYFFETVVRLHRAGEGEPYTGLKPAGGGAGEAVIAGDKALVTGDIKPLRGMLSEELGRGLQWRFREAALRQKYDKNDVSAGREYVQAYVEFIHYVEGLQAATHGKPHAHPPESTSTNHADHVADGK